MCCIDAEVCVLYGSKVTITIITICFILHRKKKKCLTSASKSPEIHYWLRPKCVSDLITVVSTTESALGCSTCHLVHPRSGLFEGNNASPMEVGTIGNG